MVANVWPSACPFTMLRVTAFWCWIADWWFLGRVVREGERLPSFGFYTADGYTLAVWIALKDSFIPICRQRFIWSWICLCLPSHKPYDIMRLQECVIASFDKINTNFLTTLVDIGKVLSGSDTAQNRIWSDAFSCPFDQIWWWRQRAESVRACEADSN